MDNNVEMIKEMILQQIKPINFGDELDIANILNCNFNDDPSVPDDQTLISSKRNPRQPILLASVENVVCHVCLKTFTSRKYLKKHFTKHTGKFSCPICGKVFTRKETQQKHIPRCKLAGDRKKKNKNKSVLNNEMSKYYCEKCCKTFTRKENYDQHVMIHNGVQIICNMCQKKLSSFKSFQRHRKMHEKPKKIACQDCPSEFTLKSNLRRHMKLLQHRNRLICRKCNKNVKTEKNYQKHLTQETISTCVICSQIFCLETDLKSHLKNEHPNLWFKCKECSKTPFMTRVLNNLQEHVKKHHSFEIQGDDCYKDGWFLFISN